MANLLNSLTELIRDHTWFLVLLLALALTIQFLGTFLNSRIPLTQKEETKQQEVYPYGYRVGTVIFNQTNRGNPFMTKEHFRKLIKDGAHNPIMTLAVGEHQGRIHYAEHGGRGADWRVFRITATGQERYIGRSKVPLMSSWLHILNSLNEENQEEVTNG